MRILFLSALALVLSSVSHAQTIVSADVTLDTTWSGNVILQQPIFVKDGATLTILPGTFVRGQPRTSAVLAGSTAGTPGALIVTRNGRLIAEGSASNPIIMTTAAVDNDNDGVADDDDVDGFADAWQAGDVFFDNNPIAAPLSPLDNAGAANVSLWGGLVVLGNAPTNLTDACGTGYGTCTVEGLTVPGFSPADATYGGVEPHDNSGTLRYISVRHAGDEIGSGNELNGITLAGVGDGTLMEHVEVYCNFDDGIEWFGGTVNGRYLHVVFAGDDTFDLDQGYTGANQFLYGIMPFFNENGGGSFGSSSGDKGGEWDGDDFDEPSVNVNLRADGTPWPLSNPAMYNLTLIGSTPDGANPAVSPASANRGVQMRSGFAGALLNSIVVNTGSAQGYDVSGGGAPGFDTVIDNIPAGLVLSVSSTFDDGAALPADELAALAAGDALAALLGGTANTVNDAGFPGLVNEDTTFLPTGNAEGKLAAGLKPVKIDPRPAFGLVGTAGGVPPQGPGLDQAATYRGAFDPTAPSLWTAGWTTFSISGLSVD